MKYLFDCLPEIKQRLRLSKGCLLMLDFDGTLSPLAPTPAQAFLPKSIKRELQKCLRLFPVIIVSGRSLSDVKHKVGLKGLVYAGNHGLEWQIGKKTSCVPAAKEAAKLLITIKQKLKKIQRAYPGVLLEDKRLSLTIHYRRLAPALVAKFKKDATRTIRLLTSNDNLQVLKGNKAIELRPNLNWNKGEFALFIHQYFQNKFKLKFLPVYVGDDATDEDAFLALTSGITIRVGHSKVSRAKYYISNPGQMVSLIQWLVITRLS
jgi:trehalose-phosphatase